MSIFFYCILIAALLFIFAIMWRLISSRWQMPCPSWLGWMVEVDNPFTKINRSENIIASLDLQKDMNVLDAGCGPGRITIPLAKKLVQGKITALDIQDKMLETVREKAKNEKLDNITFVKAGIGEGKLEQNIYDRALLVAVLGEIPDQIKALEEIFSSLKPGAILSITETIFDPHYQRFNIVVNLAERIGFEKSKVFSDSFSYNVLFKKPFLKVGRIIKNF